MPATVEGAPEAHKFVVGVILTPTPFALPQTPLTEVLVLLAEHDAVVPPLEPVHDHVHGPVPDTAVAVPAEQRFVVGAVLTVEPFEGPQAPFTAAGGAPPAGYALFDPGRTGTPPGTSTSTMLTLDVIVAWSVPICTTLVPATRSVIGMVTAKVRHVKDCVSGYGQGVG